MKHLMACTALFLILGVTFPAEARWSVLQKDERGTLSFHVESLKLLDKDRTVRVYERWQPKDSNISGTVMHNEYDFHLKQWRTRSKFTVTPSGKKGKGTRKIGPWQPLSALTPTMTHARYYRDYAQLNGPWTFVKTIPRLGRKWINPKSIRKTGTERYEVWEKTELRRSVAGTKVLLSLTEYDLRKETAETKYLSNFDASGYMTSHAATKDRWSRKTDTYGEYIGDAVKKHYEKKEM